MTNKFKLAAFLWLLAIGFAFGQDKPALKPISWKDIPSWKSISTFSVQMSADGTWMAYGMLPVEGDGDLIVQKAAEPESKKTYQIGSTNFPSFAFSENSKWIAFKEYPKDKEKKAAAKTGGKGLTEKLVLIDLGADKKTVFEKVTGYSFNGKSATHLAMQLSKEGNNGDAKGSDLLLVNLATGKRQNIGNVQEFAFNKGGEYLAYTIDAANKSGNGIYLFHVPSGTTKLVDSDTATYRSLNWTEKGEALALLKMVKDKTYKQDHGKALGIKNLGNPELSIFDPKMDSVNFPKNLTISPNRRPMWSEDLTRLFFGVHILEKEKKEPPKPVQAPVNKDSIDRIKLEKIKADTTIKSITDLQKAIAKLDTTKSPAPERKNDLPKPDMAIWHWQDSRLQSRQQVMENQDKNYSMWWMYDVRTSKPIQLQDSSVRELNIMPKEKWALGLDMQEYELDINLDGQNYRDIYAVNLQTGERKLLFKKFYLPSFASYPRPSNDGTRFLYGLDGHFYVYDIASGTSKNITEAIPTTFIETEDDHNVTKPMVNPLGWSSDDKYILLRDEWDIWQIPMGPKEKATNLTQNGRKEKIRYQFRYNLDPEDKGIDLKKGLYVRMYGEFTKKSGLARLEPGKLGLIAGPKVLLWEDTNIGSLGKAKNADVFYFTREKFNEPTNFYITNSSLANPKKVTENAPDFGKYSWSSGTRLVDYISEKGDTLQAALFLPAGYVEGKKYPTVIYYYEKLSQTLHNYSNPGFSGTGWNPGVYTSNGYAVLIPDIVYQLDDPGMSAVWCVLPAVKEALKTGVIDENKMGLHGHSWGGYQTSFLITQTTQFKAAAAGAPLTNMISMYDLIYWNSGSGNMSIFEASQGRFRGGPWENWDSYQRNSPVYFVKNVQTPLLMLHNDKDGAVDFTQGIEYYNALRRLKKPVIMVQYKGENHGLSKLENRKDYSIRMMEFFDYHLKGEKPADWIVSGIEKLKLEEHLDGRVF
jgi:dipeptidyl aminopeptidase/acylaminoacyl peptidase